MQSLEQRGSLTRRGVPAGRCGDRPSAPGAASPYAPELAVLLAYAKLTLYDDLLAAAVPDDPYLAANCPNTSHARFGTNSPSWIPSLRREVISHQDRHAVIIAAAALGGAPDRRTEPTLPPSPWPTWRWMNPTAFIG